MYMITILDIISIHHSRQSTLLEVAILCHSGQSPPPFQSDTYLRLKLTCVVSRPLEIIRIILLSEGKLELGPNYSNRGHTVFAFVIRLS